MGAVFECADCGWKGYPGFELLKSEQGGMVLYAKCCNDECNRVDRRFTDADFRQGVARLDGADVVVEAKTATAVAPTPSPVPQYKPAVVPSQVPTVRTNDASGDVLGLVRARRDQLALEVAQLEGKRIELKLLDKMIRAADRSRPPETHEAMRSLRPRGRQRRSDLVPAVRRGVVEPTSGGAVERKRGRGRGQARRAEEATQAEEIVGS